MAHDNHSSVAVHADCITDEIIYDVILGRAPVFDARFIREIGVRVVPLGVI